MEQQLCLNCGLCCNGVIFADVQLKPEDNPKQLRDLGLPLISVRGKPPETAETRKNKTPMPAKGTSGWKLPQPCAALNGCTCRVYADRPIYCRQFECLLLKHVKSGNLSAERALGIIRDARQRAEKVRRLLRALGNEDVNVALSARFRATTAALNRAKLGEDTAALYGELTLAVHDLNCLMSDAFYPGR